VHNGGSVDIIESGAHVIDNSKYLTSTNPSTGLYYRLHLLNVGVSDVKQYRCQAYNEMIQIFYLQLILLDSYNYTSVVSKVWKIEGFIVVGESIILFEVRPL
jgi:hypothetical protein